MKLHITTKEQVMQMNQLWELSWGTFGLNGYRPEKKYILCQHGWRCLILFKLGSGEFSHAGLALDMHESASFFF